MYLVEFVLYILAFIVSLLVVIKTADIFVDNLVKIGEVKGISQVILGVTASAIGTSLSEFGSAMIAVLSGSPDLGVGVVIGSNIWNIAGILGISAFIAGEIKTAKKEIRRDGLMTLLTAIILLLFMLFMDKITAIAGIILISIYVIYFVILIRNQMEKSIDSNNLENSNGDSDLNKNRSHSLKKNILMVGIGVTGLIISCRVMVWSGVEIAQIMNIPTMIIGLFALGIGTSAPELVVTLSSAMKKLHKLSLGTVLGSNVFNILIGIGVPSLFVTIPVEKLSVIFDAPVMVFVTALLLLMVYRKMKLTRLYGLVLIITYLIYITLRISFSI